MRRIIKSVHNINIKQTYKNNESYIFKKSKQIFAEIATVFGFLALFIPVDAILNGIDSFLIKLLFVILGAAVVFITITIIVLFCASIKSSIELFELHDNHKLFLEYGDVLEDKKTKCIKVFASNRCFDTIVDDDLIASNTIHGKVINNLLEKKVYTISRLNVELDNQLSMENNFELLSSNIKRKGKLNRYSVGTILETKGINKDEKLFWLGLTWFDEDLHACVSKEEYVTSLSKLMRYLVKRSQQFAIYMPIIGAGASDVASDKELLKYMIETIKLYRNELNCDIHIVIWNGKKNKIGLLENSR